MEFAAPFYSCLESDGTVTLNVMRSGPDDELLKVARSGAEREHVVTNRCFVFVPLRSLASPSTSNDPVSGCTSSHALPASPKAHSSWHPPPRAHMRSRLLVRCFPAPLGDWLRSPSDAHEPWSTWASASAP